MNTIRQGDIFSCKTPDGRFVFGRILLHIAHDCIGSGLVNKTSPLHNWNDSLLVELYDTLDHTETCKVFTPLITSLYVDAASFTPGIHNIVGHRPVTVAEVDFPETLTCAFDGKVYFEKGEIELEVDMDEEEFDALDCCCTVHDAGSIPDISLPLLGLRKLCLNPIELKHSDLRFCEPHLRYNVRVLSGYNPHKTYYEQVRALGLDPGRFFK